jgi:hypothetical protein
MDIQTVNAQDKIMEIRIRLGLGKITYEEAREQVVPYLEVINAKGREVARRFNRTHYPLTFSGAMR